MVKLIHESTNYQYLISSKGIVLVDKNQKEEKILFDTKKKLILIQKNNDKSVFCVYSNNQIVLLNFNTNTVSDLSLKGYITRIKISNNMGYLVVFENFPQRIAIIKLEEILKVLSEKPFKEIGLKKPKFYAPRIDFEIFEDIKIIAIAYMSNLHFYDLYLNRLLQMTHGYYRTFLTATEKVNNLFEEINNTDFPPDKNCTQKEVSFALKLFGLKKNFSEDELKDKFKKMIKENHPDINPSKDSTKISAKIIESYSLLKELRKSPTKERTKIEFLIKKKQNKTDWFSLIQLIRERIYLGTYSGRVIGISYERIRNLLLHLDKQKGLIVTDINFFQDYYFKSPVDDLNIVFNLEENNNMLLIDTSSNPFSKKGFRDRWTDYKRYVKKLAC